MESKRAMASQPQNKTGKVDTAQSDHDWTSPLLSDHPIAPSYVDPDWPLRPCKEKRTTLSREAKALVKSSVGTPGVHPWHIPIEISIGTLGLGFSASILDDPHCLGRQSPSNHMKSWMSNG